MIRSCQYTNTHRQRRTPQSRQLDSLSSNSPVVGQRDLNISVAFLGFFKSLYLHLCTLLIQLSCTLFLTRIHTIEIKGVK